MAADIQILTGLPGTVTLPSGMVQEIASITLKTGAVLLPTPHYGGKGWVTRIAGVKDFGGSFVAYVAKGGDDAGGSTNPFLLVNDTTSQAMTILYSPGCLVTANVMFSNIEISSEYAGLVMMTADFAKADDVDLTVSWIGS